MTLLELLDLMKKRIKLVIGLPIACALIIGVYSFMFMPDTYTATTSMYVLTNQDQSSGSLSTDLSASQMVASDFISMLKSNRVCTAAADDLGLKNLNDYEIAVTNASTSRVIELSVTGADPELAAKVANSIVQNAVSFFQDIVKIETVNIVDTALAPVAPTGPSRPMYIAVAFMGGLFMAIAAVVVADMLNTKVHTADEAEEILGVPVIGRIPVVKGGR